MTLALAWLVSEGRADDRQFRQLELVDGRSLIVEVLSTESTGLLVQVPEGRALVSFELLLDMAPTDQATYDTQAPWVVYVDLPPADQEEALVLLGAIPGLSVHPLSEPAGGATPAMVAAAAGCERDVDCVARAFANSPWKWLVTGSEAPGGKLVIHSKVSTSSERAQRAEVEASKEGLWVGLHAALELQPPTTAPPKAPGTARSSTEFDEKRVVALSFVPVPGLPSLAQGDAGGFALALGVVAPSTVVWVGAVGRTGQSVPEFAALSAAGYYAVTVLANQVTGFRTLEKSTRIRVGVAPAPGGGTVTLGGRLD